MYNYCSSTFCFIYLKMTLNFVWLKHWEKNCFCGDVQNEVDKKTIICLSHDLINEIFTWDFNSYNCTKWRVWFWDGSENQIVTQIWNSEMTNQQSSNLILSAYYYYNIPCIFFIFILLLFAGANRCNKLQLGIITVHRCYNTFCFNLFTTSHCVGPETWFLDYMQWFCIPQ